jgi:hypothetical protein
MQVRHIEENRLVLDKAEKLDPELLPSVQQEKPWEEVLECLAVLAAIHAQPCQATVERRDEEKHGLPQKDEPDPENA